jgi:hypothetical protein
MSGGSYNYTCFRIEEEYVGHMHDAELDELMKDIYKVTHDLEWWQSCDIGEDDYRKTVLAFKKKWFGKRDERLKGIIETKCAELKAELLTMIGETT